MKKEKTVRVLHVEDDRDTAILLAEQLRGVPHVHFEIHWADRLQAAIDWLKQKSGDVILLDLTLPDSSGLTTVEKVRAASSEMPIVVMTGRQEEKTGIEAIRRGAQDYLVKGLADGPVVARAILYAIDRKQAEMELLDLQATLARAERERLEDKYRVLVENIPAITYTASLDADLTITYLSPQAKTMLGFDANLFQQKSDLWVERLHPEDRDPVMAAVRQAVASRQPFDLEYRLLHRDGAPLWFRDCGSVVVDRNGVPLFLQGVMYDITPRKRLESEAEEYRLRLQSLAATLSVTEEQNRWHLSRQIHDTVVQSLSLACIRLDMLRKEMGGSDEAALRAGVDGIRELIDDAIAQSRSLMSNLTPPLLYEMGLTPALEELADGLERKHGVPVQVEAGANPPDLPDSLRGFLFQSAQELIMNALKHAHARRIVVRLQSGPGTFTLRVEDDGRGFRQESPAVRERGGFGLFSIQERAVGLGGSFGLESAPGRGTRAFVTVPMKATTEG